MYTCPSVFVKLQDGTGISVPYYPAFEMHGCRFIVHHAINDGEIDERQWVVAEITSTVRVTVPSLTRKAAIAEAQALLQKRGEEDTRYSVRGAQERYLKWNEDRLTGE